MSNRSVQNFDVNTLTPIFNFLLKGVQHADREDVKSESIVRILTAIVKGAVRKDTFSFAHTVVQRTVFDYYRKKNLKIVQASTLVNFCDGADEERGSTKDYFSYATEEVGYRICEVRTDYLNNKAVFTPQERRIINMLLFTDEGSDMKPTEIANELGINRSHASRAMSKLKLICAV